MTYSLSQIYNATSDALTAALATLKADDPNNPDVLVGEALLVELDAARQTEATATNAAALTPTALLAQCIRALSAANGAAVTLTTPAPATEAEGRAMLSELQDRIWAAIGTAPSGEIAAALQKHRARLQALPSMFWDADFASARAADLATAVTTAQTAREAVEARAVTFTAFLTWTA